MKPLVWLPISTRRKIISTLLVIGLFTVLVGMTSLALGHPPGAATTNAALVGLGVGFFEEFYFQTSRGAWLRSVHPLLSMSIYTTVVAAFVIIAIFLSHYFIWNMHEVPDARRLLLVAMPVFTAISGIGVLLIRVVHFLGADTLFHLVVGTYHRPIIETRVLMFLDINDSTELAERVGALATRSLVGQFLSAISKPITDHGGDIYLYKGDGLIATWGEANALRRGRILRAIDGVFGAIARKEPVLHRQFGVVPTFRIGVHGGDVVVSEQGDDRRSIGIYGDTINIAARMEQAAKEHGVGCVISGPVATKLEPDVGLIPLVRKKVRGIAAPIPIYEYRPVIAGRPPAYRACARPSTPNAPVSSWICYAASPSTRRPRS
jgi:class 3 adenylate cyclase